jgi:ArsR family transcriptional regulator
MEQSKALQALSALAHEARLDLIKLLFGCGTEGLCAGAIGKNLALPATRLSFHLSILENAGLIKSRRSARNIIYSVNSDGIAATISFLMNDCCKTHPDIVACCNQQATRACNDVILLTG